MNEVEKINFHGNEIIVVEQNGQKYVAMKPIAEAMGLAWVDQLKIIKRDAVLSSGMCVTHIPSNGGIQETVCLPLEYLNGWLFKVPASRYSGKKRQAIELYQRECYRALYNYWHHGAAVNPNATDAQIIALITTLQEEAYIRGKLEEQNRQLKKHCELLAGHAVPSDFGKISEVTGLPRDILIGTYARSDRKPHRPQHGKIIQLCLPLFTIQCLS